MALLSDSWLLDSLSLLTSLAIIIVISWLNWTHTYWQRKGLANPPVHFFFWEWKTTFHATNFHWRFHQGFIRLFKYS
jgi:hypothetical protein